MTALHFSFEVRPRGNSREEDDDDCWRGCMKTLEDLNSLCKMMGFSDVSAELSATQNWAVERLIVFGAVIFRFHVRRFDFFIFKAVIFWANSNDCIFYFDHTGEIVEPTMKSMLEKLMHSSAMKLAMSYGRQTVDKRLPFSSPLDPLYSASSEKL